ncbi:MAG: entericidin EcnA/B family protein [Pseudorhodobacter sp.]|jgi:predicted small secreted protein|nr:entericidin EcnA/B family protein [Pseudorhodobacter sp.]
MNMRKLRHGLALGFLVALASCGTVEGFGRDLSGAAERTSRLF